MNKKRFFRTFILAAIIFSALFYFLGDGILFWNNISSSGSDKDTIEPDYKDKVLFLLVGVDANDVAESEGDRTDTMILTGVDFGTGQINMMSIPRDTRVLKDNGYHDKINHAHAYGGIDLTLETVNKLTKLNVNNYVKLDYTAVREVVDTIGGVDIYVPHRMVYDDTTAGKEFHIDLYEGQQTLNGEQAIQFLRWRKNNDGTGYPQGDVGRIQAQQAFLKELMKQSLSAKNITKVPKFIDIYNQYIDTNIPLDTVLRGVKIARKFNTETMNTATVPGEGQYINGISYFVYDEQGLNTMIDEMFGNFR